jgi:hypothetical protein
MPCVNVLCSSYQATSQRPRTYILFARYNPLLVMNPAITSAYQLTRTIADQEVISVFLPPCTFIL